MLDDFDSDDFDLESEESELEVHPETVAILEQEYEFERNFYIAVCETEQFEVVPIPDSTGYVLTQSEQKLVEAEGQRQGIKILYRISHGNFATVFDPDTGKVGVMPERQSKGFAC